MKIKLNFVIVLTILSALFSCSTDLDDNQNEKNVLVGEWHRIDSNASFENIMILYSDNTGTKISKELFVDGTAISNAVSLEWNSSTTNLQLMMHEEINTPYSFNEDGQLILSAISEIPFVRVD